MTTPTPGASGPASHVFVVVFENHEYEAVVGNSATPYLNELIARYGLATSYYANAHPSIGNYFMMTTGTLPTDDDRYSGTVADDNLARVLAAAGLGWKVYAQGLPAPGYLGPDQFPYARNHNPFALFTDVTGDPTLAQRIVPLDALAADNAADKLPSYAFVVPDAEHNGHDCPGGGSRCTDGDKLAMADAWLRTVIGPIVDGRTFQASGLMFITFDEGDPADDRNGGGHVATVVVSARTPAHSVSSRLYQHQSLLATVVAALKLPRAPGAAANAPVMSDLFPP